MARLVMKFGGSSLGDIQRMRHAAGHIAREYNAGHEVAVVVSAMAGETDRLANLVREAAPLHDAREYDSIVATGEQVSAGMMAIILQTSGISARSWLGWQLALNTDGTHGAARIVDIRDDLLNKSLAAGQVAIICGFQGIGPDTRITTLGRGGSDTSAVAIAAALRADCCDIYTDVDGVYTADPRVVPEARRLGRISYEEMLEMASLGAKVLQTRSVEMAMTQGIRLRVRSTFEEPDAFISDIPALDSGIGTLVCDEDEIVEQQIVSGITYARDEAKVTLLRVADKPGVAAGVFGPLAQAAINVDMIVQNISDDGKSTDLTFTVAKSELDRAIETIGAARDQIGYQDLSGSTDIVKVSIVGIGMRSHAGVAAKMFQTLADHGINIQAIATSEIKISVLIDAAYAELAIRALHAAYGLDV